MNFLAHLYLAKPGAVAPPGMLVGSLLPDIWRGRLPELPADVAAGVASHRRVDRFTDRHPMFLRSRARLRPQHGVFAGVLVDMAYDHLLAGQWDRWHDLPLDAFIDAAHRAIADHEASLPERVARIARRMREGNWLGMYRDPDDLRVILGMMSRRFADRFERVVDLTPAVETIRQQRVGLEVDFALFFPDMIRHVKQVPSPGADERAAARSSNDEDNGLGFGDRDGRRGSGRVGAGE